MLKTLLVMSSLLLASGAADAATVENLRCEFRKEPRGVDCAKPRLSWNLSSMKRGDGQTAYRVLVASSSDLLARGRGDLWDSGKVVGAESTNVEYGGVGLPSGATAFWKVEVWDKDGKQSGWSSVASFSMGLLNQADWKGQWIGMESAGENECPWLRKSFTLEKVPESALAYVASIGYHELYINGHRVGDGVLAPSTSDLGKRALYSTYDLKPYLKPGANAVGLWVAPGWSQFKNGTPAVAPYAGKRSLVLAQLQFGVMKGPFTTVASDDSWRCSLSSTTHLGQWQYADFGGDSVDARREVPGWSNAGFDDAAWEKATTCHPGLQVSSDFVEPNRKLEQIAATEVTEVSPGKYRFTMAKLFTGWAQVALKGAPGQKIVIHCSSLPTKEEEYNQRDETILGPTGEGTFCNRFSYHEIAFVTVEGLTNAPSLTDVVGFRVGNDRQRIGTFDCSNALLKQIYDITVNTYENLTTGGMTVDCPHRERLGYGGDAHDSMEMALDTFGSEAFFSKWAQDWCDIQQPEGRIAHTAPQTGGGGGPAWSGFIITMPWEVYQSCGDRRILEKTYPAARRWLDFMESHVGADGLLSATFGGSWSFLGDWVAPGRRESSEKPETQPFNNCYYLYVTRLAAKTAAILGHSEDASILTARANRLQAAINTRFMDPVTKAYFDTRQTRTVMALMSGTVAPENLGAVMKNLENEILVDHKGHLDTGLHGTYYMTKYLTEHERSDLIFTYATQTTYPSYGDLIAKGYTTWPEYWAGSDSRMHGCLNGIGGWFTKGIGGIRADAPGFKHFIIRPAIVGDLTWAKAEFHSVQGLIVSHWKRDGSNLTLEITVPTNTSATVFIPAADAAHVEESGRLASRAQGVKFLRMQEGSAVYEVESGHYNFEREGAA